MDKTFLGVVSAAVEQSSHKANMVAQTNSAFEAEPRILSKKVIQVLSGTRMLNNQT